jgi:hypothetical protein
MATVTVTKGYNNPTGWISGETVTPEKLNSSQTPSVSISAIQTADISDAQITADKLALGAVTGAAGGGKLAASVITGQTDIDSVATGDSILIYDLSNTALREATIAQLQSVVQPSGSLLKTLRASTTATTTISTAYALGTKPQYNVNNIILTQEITPSSETSKILITATIGGYNSVSGSVPVVALFNTTSGDAIAATVGPNASTCEQFVLTFLHEPASTSQITYRVGVGPNTTSGGNFVLNGVSGVADSDLGGLRESSLLVQEIKG